MISFVTVANDFTRGTKYGDQFHDCLEASVLRTHQPFRMFKQVTSGNILTAYNEGLDLHAKELAYCEKKGDRPQNFNCAVLVHPDVEFIGPDLEAKLAATFADESIAVAGVIGARSHPGMEWWLGEPKFGYVHHKEGEGGVYFSKGSDNEVDIIDGMFIALSPWFAERFRYDPTDYEPPCWHCAAEIACAEAQMLGKRVMQIDYELAHRTTPSFAGGEGHWRRLDEVVKRKYFRHLNGLKRKWSGRKA